MQRKLAATEAKILLRFWSSRATWKGWQGRGLTWPHTLAGCTGLKSCIPPASLPLGQTLSFSPHCRRCLVVSTTASAAQPILEGSSSRGLDCGPAGELCCPMMWRPRMLGITTASTRTPWTCCWWLHTRVSRWQLTLYPKTSMGCSSDAQQVTLGSWASGKFSNSGGLGSDAWAPMSSSRSSLSHAFSLGLPGGDPGQSGEEKVRGLIEHYVAGWKAKMQGCCNSEQLALSAETLQGACVGHAAWGCVVPASPGGSHVDFVEDVRRCLLKVDITTEAAPLKSPQHLFALRTLAILIGCSAMASGGKGYYAAQAAASSSSGGDPAPGWRAADSLMMIAAQRARQWREGEGLLDDNDFAYAYTDYDQVVGLAGHHVADDWLQTRPRKSSLQLGPKSWRTTLRVR